MKGRRMFFAELGDFGRCLRLSLGVETHDSHGETVTFAAKPVAFEQLPDNGYAPPALELRPNEAQQLMDELWRCGFRPSEGTGSAGSLAATERHLDDMRRITFALMPVPDELLQRGGQRS